MGKELQTVVCVKCQEYHWKIECRSVKNHSGTSGLMKMVNDAL